MVEANIVDGRYARGVGSPWRLSEIARIRMFDVTVGAAALLCALPIMAVVALLIYISDGGPAIFVQFRIGQSGKLFPCLKFRSMRLNAEQHLAELLESDPEAKAEWDAQQKLKNDPRITRFGRFLRKYSLDELPQLLNVLCGHMSVVGPRPIVPGEAWRYGRRIAYYHAIRPGLTGLWQVSGRSDTSYRKRVAMDVVYARSKTLALDARILAATIPSVLMTRGSF